MRRTAVLAFLLLLAGIRGSTDACCPAPRSDHRVNIARQEILVAWNPQTRIEHFVRRATFDTSETGKDFGFLVPTPSKPALAEAADAAFDRLAAAIRPEEREVVETRYDLSLLALLFRSVGATRGVGAESAGRDAVTVLERVRVAGYDATVLEAEDAGALTRWLAENGYAVRPEITDWVAPYVAKRWKVTAFKYSPEARAEVAHRTGGVGTGSVRMTFSTDRPLFPYRVPADQRGGRDTLRVYYVGGERAEGTLGDRGEPWDRELKFSNAVATLNEMLDGAIPRDQAAGGTWLTAFEDHRWPGGSEDLYFAPAADRSPYLPPPIVHTVVRRVFVPLDVILVVLLVVIGVIWRLRARATVAGDGV